MFIQKDDWKKEKHMPVIEVAGAGQGGRGLSGEGQHREGNPTPEHH